jgi:hypothetical protein
VNTEDTYTRIHLTSIAIEFAAPEPRQPKFYLSNGVAFSTRGLSNANAIIW